MTDLLQQVKEALSDAAYDYQRLGQPEVALKYDLLHARLDGMRLVPEQPTRKMVQSGGWSINECRVTSPDTHTNDVATLAYRAMLEAAKEGE